MGEVKAPDPFPALPTYSDVINIGLPFPREGARDKLHLFAYEGLLEGSLLSPCPFTGKGCPKGGKGGAGEVAIV